MDRSNGRLVQVFKTDDPGVLPLAEMALDAEGIEYTVRNVGKADTMDWSMSQRPTIRPVVMEIVVTPEMEARAREVLADLSSQIEKAGDAGASFAETALPPGIVIERADTGRVIADVSEEDLQAVTSHLEDVADSRGPQHYLVDPDGLDRLAYSGAGADLVTRLRQELGEADDLVIRWVVR
jgi:hypothetical protein